MREVLGTVRQAGVEQGGRQTLARAGLELGVNPSHRCRGLKDTRGPGSGTYRCWRPEASPRADLWRWRRPAQPPGPSCGELLRPAETPPPPFLCPSSSLRIRIRHGLCSGRLVSSPLSPCVWPFPRASSDGASAPAQQQSPGSRRTLTWGRHAQFSSLRYPGLRSH